MSDTFEVIIPISPNQYESWDWVEHKRKKVIEMTEWLASEKIPYIYTFIKGLYETDGAHCHVVSFKNPRHAVLFKLKFQGT